MPSVSRSARGVEALRVAKLRVQQVEEELENAKREVRRLEEVELPAAFTEDGISELQLPGGQRARRQISVQGSFPDQETDPERHRRAVQLWAELGYQDTLRCAVVASYSTEEREAAQAAYNALRGDNRAFVTMRETVHPSTLRAAILARIREGQPTPLEELGCVVIRRVRLTTPPRRQSSTRTLQTAADIEEEDQ